MRHFGRPRILICDDEPAVRTICARALTLAGYDSVAVGGGREASETLARETFDGMLLDVRMHDMDGPEVMEALREHDPDLPVVVISGYSAFEDAIRCLRFGAVDFVKKPFDVETLVRAVDRAVASTHLKADSAVLAASQSIFSSLDSWEIGRRVLQVVRSLLRADMASLALPGGGAGGGAGGEGESAPGVTLRAVGDDTAEAPPPSPALWRRLLDLRDPVVFDLDQPGDAEVVPLLAPGMHAVMVHRLMVGDRAAGLLLAARSSDGRAFGERDLRRVSLVAGHAALALENARLHAERAAQARELEQAFDRLVVAERVAMLSRLSASLGHEVSNPACAMLASIELARDALAAGRSGDVDEALVRAQVAVNSILDVCAALRPLAAHSSPRRELVDLRRVIDGAVMLATYEIRPRARLTLAIPDDLPLVPGDPAKLGQVFLNLLLNAAQAVPLNAPDEHEIRIVVATEGTELGHMIVARVEDTGHGVPAELLPRLFQPSQTTRAAADGHGMGLAVCRWIIEEAGGTIRCLPDLPRGAVFELRLHIRPL